jgi:hypothetical protein
VVERNRGYSRFPHSDPGALGNRSIPSSRSELRSATIDSLIQMGVCSITWDSIIQARDALGHYRFPNPNWGCARSPGVPSFWLGMRWLIWDSLEQPGGTSATEDFLIQARGAMANLGFPHSDQDALGHRDSFLPSFRSGMRSPPGISSFRWGVRWAIIDSICSQSVFATFVGTAIIKLFGSIVTTTTRLKRPVFPLKHRRFWRSISGLKSSNGGKKFKLGV